MELEQFVKDSLIAIQKGLEGAKTGNLKAAKPIVGDGAHGVEFDLGIQFGSGKLCVVDKTMGTEQFHSRLKFSVPIISNE